MSEVKVRAAQASDETALMALAEREMHAHEVMDERFRLRPDAHDRYALYLRNRMRDLDSTVFVAYVDGELVGLAIGSIRKQEGFFLVQRYGYVSDLMVAPGARRRGIGRALYDRIVLWFRGLGIDVIRLHIATRSEEARAFWRTIGAEDFLTEAWIEIKSDVKEEETGGVEADASASVAPAPSIDPAIDPVAPSPFRESTPPSVADTRISPRSDAVPPASRRSAGHEFLGDALLGGPEGGV